MPKVLIAPWGDPSRWEEREYIPPVPENQTPKTVKSATSLIPLWLAEKPDRCAIISLFTLADCGQDFNSLVANARMKVENRLCIEKETHRGEKEFATLKPQIIVAPGLGKFGRKIFNIAPQDFYAYTLWQLSNFLLETLKNAPDFNLDILVDITHGINYQTFFVRRAVANLAMVAAFALDNVRVRVYNSDPFVRGTRSSLNINVIEELEVAPDIPIFPRKSENADDKVIIRAKAFLGALKVGAPLVLFYAFQNPKSLADHIQSEIDKFENNLEISFEEQQIKIEPKYHLSEPLEFLILAHFLEKLIDKRFPSLFSAEVEKASLNQMRQVMNDLFCYTEEGEPEPPSRKKASTWYFVHNEFRVLWEILNSSCDLTGKDNENGWYRWAVFYFCKRKRKSNSKSSGEQKTELEKMKRNFLAHAGFEVNILWIKKDPDGTIWLKYKPQDLDKIFSFCYDFL